MCVYCVSLFFYDVNLRDIYLRFLSMVSTESTARNRSILGDTTSIDDDDDDVELR